MVSFLFMCLYVVWLLSWVSCVCMWYGYYPGYHVFVCGMATILGVMCLYVVWLLSWVSCVCMWYGYYPGCHVFVCGMATILGISMKITTAVCVLDFRIPRTQWYLLLMSTTYHTRYTDVRLVFTGYFLYIAANEYSAISLRRALSD